MPNREPGALDRAILSTIAYRDVFDFPVTMDEIHRYLHSIACEPDDIADALASLRHVATDGEFFALRGRGALFDIRRARRTIARQQQPVAIRLARFLASLPNVRMVGLTGSLAAQNAPPDGDIDFLLVTDAGTMWRTRALCRVLAKVSDTLGKGLLCPNMFVSKAAMTLERHSLYDAQELCQMVPLHGMAEYEALRDANRWTDTFLPNATGAPDTHDHEPRWPGVKRLSESALNSPLGRGIERFEARRKMYRFNETNRLKGAWTRSTPEVHSLWDDMRLKIEDAWRRRLDAIVPG